MNNIKYINSRNKSNIYRQMDREDLVMLLAGTSGIISVVITEDEYKHTYQYSDRNSFINKYSYKYPVLTACACFFKNYVLTTVTLGATLLVAHTMIKIANKI